MGLGSSGPRGSTDSGNLTVNINGALFSTAQQVGKAVAHGVREARRGGQASGARV